jgi:hypothetical protein
VSGRKTVVLEHKYTVRDSLRMTHWDTASRWEVILSINLMGSREQIKVSAPMITDDRCLYKRAGCASAYV